MITHKKYETIMMFLHLILRIDEVKELMEDQEWSCPTALVELLDDLSQASKDFIKAEIG